MEVAIGDASRTIPLCRTGGGAPPAAAVRGAARLLSCGSSASASTTVGFVCNARTASRSGAAVALSSASRAGSSARRIGLAAMAR
jgi:hypothetical protein